MPCARIALQGFLKGPSLKGLVYLYMVALKFLKQHHICRLVLARGPLQINRPFKGSGINLGSFLQIPSITLLQWTVLIPELSLGKTMCSTTSSIALLINDFVDSKKRHICDTMMCNLFNV